MAQKGFDDTLSTLANQGFSPAWDWKGEYVSGLGKDGYERFSQLSASPDSTAVFGGPARYTGIAGNTQKLTPVGLSDGFQFSDNVQVSRLFEIGSNRSFFTRGKSAPTIMFSKMLADQANILSVLTENTGKGLGGLDDQGYNSPGAQSPKQNIMMNLGSEFFAVPFGMLLVFKTKGGDPSTNTGQVLTALYLEYCMFSQYNFQISAEQPVIQENVSIEFDRPVPVSFQ